MSEAKPLHDRPSGPSRAQLTSASIGRSPTAESAMSTRRDVQKPQGSGTPLRKRRHVSQPTLHHDAEPISLKAISADDGSQSGARTNFEQ